MISEACQNHKHLQKSRTSPLGVLALPNMWYLPLFIVHKLFSQFCLWLLCPSLPPIQHLFFSLPPSLLPSHSLIPLHTSINRALQSAQSHTVLNAAVVQLQWAAIDLNHWIKRGRKAERAKTRDEPHSAFFYPPFPLDHRLKPLALLKSIVKLLLPLPVSTHARARLTQGPVDFPKYTLCTGNLTDLWASAVTALKEKL